MRSLSPAARLLAQRRKAQATKALAVDPPFAPQDTFVASLARFLDAQCSRRAGKSSGLARRFKRTMDKWPKSTCIYLALTRESAANIMWPVLQEMNERLGWGCTFLDGKLLMTAPNGAKLRLYGADQKHFIKRLKGQKSPGIAVDEAQDFGPHLQSLVDDVLSPMMADYADSWLAIVGTPGPVPQGYYFEVTKQHKYGYEHHEWTINDNPHIPDAEGFIQSLIMKNQWEPNHPTLLREWRNQWVLDVQALWVQYKADIDDFADLPADVKKWEYILGIDVGFDDADAIAVLAWSRENRTTYLVEEVITTKQGPTALAAQIKGLCSKYPVTQMVMDQGALGKKIAEDMKTIHHIAVEAADKAGKQANVEFLNDALRLGGFKAHKESRFAQDSYLVQIDWDKSTPDRIVVKKKPHSDIIDAVLYAYKLSPAYNYKPVVVKPKPGSSEFSKAQEALHIQSAMEQLQRQKDITTGKGLYGSWNKDKKGVPDWNKW